MVFMFGLGSFKTWLNYLKIFYTKCFFLFCFLLYSDTIQMTILYFNILTIFGHFFANCMVIFQKTEFQTVILRCLTGLHLDWFRHYGLRCRWRPCTCLANSQKIATDKWPFCDHFWPFFCQLYVYLSQN